SQPSVTWAASVLVWDPRSSAAAKIRRIKAPRIVIVCGLSVFYLFRFIGMSEFRRLKKTALAAFACFKRNQQFQMPLPVPAFNSAESQRLP
ncbi:MAG: hypothetical protein ACREE6_04070, partial [Limisphaerales bacterium]